MQIILQITDLKHFKQFAIFYLFLGNIFCIKFVINKIIKMKKTIFSIFTASILLIACNKTDMQQATDTIKNADSLFQEAKESYKTLDSISKIVKDSGNIAVKDIDKHKEVIENAVKKGNLSIDSLNKQFQKIKAKTQNNEEIAKAIDSVTNAIKSGDINSLKNIEETVNKVIKETKKQPTPKVEEETTIPQNEVKISPKKVEIQPIIKSANLELEVDDLAATKFLLEQSLNNNNGEILTNRFDEIEGIAQQFITVKVPLSSFNNLVNSVSSLGQVTSKSTEVEGNDYLADQMCDVKIILTDKTPESSTLNDDLNALNKDENKDETFGKKTSNAFLKGFSGLGSLFLALIPFWPIFLIGGIIWYFVAKRNKKKREEEFQRQLALEKERLKNAENQKADSSENVQIEEKNEQPTTEEPKNDDDLSKYMPKE